MKKEVQKYNFGVRHNNSLRDLNETWDRVRSGED